jgi:hypothetical protein
LCTHRQLARRDQPGERANHTASEQIDDERRRGKSHERPVLMDKMVHSVTRHAAKGAARSDNDPREHRFSIRTGLKRAAG